jgi:uncharacterized protein YxjI
MLNLTQYLIKERVDFLKLSGQYDILDPATQTKVGEAREEISIFLKLLRMLINKQLLPTRLAVYEADGDARTLLFSISRGPAIFKPKVMVTDASGASLGYFQSKFLSLGGAFQVFTAEGPEVALVKGDWKGWNFRFLAGETELGVVAKKWTGFGKELFTSADNYMISINGTPNSSVNILLLAAGLAIDTVLKENG